MVSCGDLDDALQCSGSDDPVYIPVATLGATGAATFRDILPLPASGHPNECSLNMIKGRIIPSSYFYKLPRATVVYEKNTPHAKACAAKYCVIPDGLRAHYPADVAYPSAKKPARRHPARPPTLLLPALTCLSPPP